MSCDIKSRLIDTVKTEIKGDATSYKFEKERVFIPVQNNTNRKITAQEQAIEIGRRITNKINLKYKPWYKRELVSLDTSLQSGVYINIHPDTTILDNYQHAEDRKDSGIDEDGKGEFFQLSPKVNYQFKAVEKITNSISRIERLWNQIKDKEVFWKKIGQELGIPKEQIELLKNSDGNTIEEKLTSFLASYSFAVEVNTTKIKGMGSQEGNPYFDNIEGGDNTDYYSNLTVPGGTNGSYREVNIESPLITLPKSHAQFNTEHTLMFARMDDAQAYSEKDIEKLISLMENNEQLEIKCD